MSTDGPYTAHKMSQHLPHGSQQEHVDIMFLAGLGDAVPGNISASICLAGCMHKGIRQGQYQSFAYPIVSKYSSEILPLETLHACLTEEPCSKKHEP